MIAFVVLITLAACWTTTSALHEQWTAWHDSAYTHGYLIAAISAYLIWRNSRTAPFSSSRGSWPASAGLLVAGLLWIFGIRSGIAAISWFVLPILVILAIWMAMGLVAARRNLFAVAFLYFAMPLWGPFNPAFQWGTVYVVRGMLRLVGIPSHFVGNFVQIPAGNFEIAGGCSGMHYAIVALAIAALMGEVRGDGVRGRIKLLVVAGLLALVTNWVRVFVIILAGHFTNMQHYIVSNSHATFGWLLFLPAMVVFFVLEGRMRVEASPPIDAAINPGDKVGGVRGLAGLALVMTFIAALQWLSARPAAVELSSPRPSAQWVSADLSEIARSDSPKAERIDRRAFLSSTGNKVDRHEYLFASQRPGKELGDYPGALFSGFSVVSSRQAQVGGLPLTLSELRDSPGSHWLVATRYGVTGKYFSSPFRAQLQYALGSMALLRSQPASVKVWIARCLDDCRAAEESLKMFLIEAEGEG